MENNNLPENNVNVVNTGGNITRNLPPVAPIPIVENQEKVVPPSVLNIQPKLPSKKKNIKHLLIIVLLIVCTSIVTYFGTRYFLNKNNNSSQTCEETVKEEIKMELSAQLEQELRTNITSELASQYQNAVNLFLERYEKEIEEIAPTILTRAGVWELLEQRCPEVQQGQVSCIKMEDVYTAFPNFTKEYIDSILSQIQVNEEGYLIYSLAERDGNTYYNDIDGVKIVSIQKDKMEFMVTHSYCKEEEQFRCAYNETNIADEYLNFEEYKYTLVLQDGKWLVEELEFPF